ncbi:predicted protein [Naegleria gruberi]|uniref:Predicted protein n=1 Tax=Naegleria gruberi TaxID=5762 RepID=D2VD88_NAEGR|nr:uncharacterized protein NAEGRDRAFT_66947 [Naegleria gruberi]EFC45189.1 predicted protein [Naegleria gruberi]|eukprot:XP_002677933.1 predicted protein [Naegleria gruberi strain NEG-M]
MKMNEYKKDEKITTTNNNQLSQISNNTTTNTTTNTISSLSNKKINSSSSNNLTYDNDTESSIEEGIYSRDSSKPRVFLGDGGFFVSTRGCVINNSIVIILAVEAIFYIVVEIVFLVLSFITPRDTWFIKRETLVLITLQFLAIILFAICGFLDAIANFTDYFVPFGFVLMTYSFVEVIVCVLFPILVYSNGKIKNGKDSELEQFLMNKRTFTILLDFARRSYCPESVLCYRDIERYKLTSKKNRKKAALKITKTYLKTGSPLELNFPKLNQTFEEYSQIINNSNNNQSLLETSLFESIQLHCLDDMRDVFDRLKNQSKETRNILEQWKLQQQLKEMDDININMNNNNSTTITMQQQFEDDSYLPNVESIDLSNINNNQNIFKIILPIGVFEIDNLTI